MGWKAIKEYYRIAGIVRVEKGHIWVGNGIFHDEIIIDASGTIVGWPRRMSDPVFHGYVREMEADPDTLRRLVTAPDQFNQSIPVYTYAGADILEKACETPGYPNVTHDGNLMYDNEYAQDKHLVVEWAKQDARAGISLGEREITATEARLQALRAELARDKADLERLHADYPERPR